MATTKRSFATFGNELYTGRRSINFIGLRRRWYALAALFIVIAIVSMLVRGLNPSIEFSGGSEFQVTGVSNTSDRIGQQAVLSVAPEAGQPQVTGLGSSGIRVQTSKLTSAQTDQVATALAKAYGVDTTAVTSSYVGPSWGQDVSRKAITGLIVFLVLVCLMIAVYFRTWTMAAAALVALLHDLVLTVGVYALVGFEVSPASVIGFLTILGYSLYDTVVVFDKVRENTAHVLGSTRRTFAEAANLAVNQTLVRSINTSVVALLPVASILFIGSLLLGAGTLKDISLALFVGIAAGTYSSIFIATPLLVDLRNREPEMQAQAERVRRRRESEARAAATESGRSGDDLAGDSGSEAGQDWADEAGADGVPATGQRRAGPPAAGTPRRGGTTIAERKSAASGQRPQPKRASRDRRR